VAGFRVAGFRVAGFRVAGFRVAVDTDNTVESTVSGSGDICSEPVGGER